MTTIRYLSQTELAASLTEELGQLVTVKMVQDWRRPDRTKAAASFPRPDAWIGDAAESGFGHRNSTPGWRAGTVARIVAWRAGTPAPGRALPVIHYLSQPELAAGLGVATSTIQTWRHRYGNDRSAAAVATARSFPEPDAWIGDPGKLAFGNRNATPGWRGESVEKLAAWRESLPGIGGTPRPGRRKAAR